MFHTRPRHGSTPISNKAIDTCLRSMGNVTLGTRKMIVTRGEGFSIKLQIEMGIGAFKITITIRPIKQYTMPQRIGQLYVTNQHGSIKSSFGVDNKVYTTVVSGILRGTYKFSLN